jgi:hypothetical protein
MFIIKKGEFMSLILNTGKYTVIIGVTWKNLKPGDTWGVIDSMDWDVGSGTVEIGIGECRYVNGDSHFFRDYGILTVCAIATQILDRHIINTAQIGAHEFWEFNGQDFFKRDDLNQNNCSKCNGF